MSEAAEPTPMEFLRATRAEPLGEGLYRGTIDPGWFGPPGPNGGVVAALVLRAIRAEISQVTGGEERHPRSLTLHYLRPLQAGDVEVEVIVERSGHTASTCSARLSQNGKLMCIALCVLTFDFEGMDEWSPEMPSVSSPADVPELSLSGTPPPMFERLETRGVFGPPPFSGGKEAVTGGWLRTRDGDALTPELVTLFSDAWWPAPFSRLDAPSMAPTLELTIHFRARPEPGDEQALVRFTSDASIDGLFDEAGEIWGTDGRLIAQSRQIALLRPWTASPST